jgi:hypothetical protein
VQQLGKKSRHKKIKKILKAKSQAPRADQFKYTYWIILTFVIFFIVIIRLRLLSIPLERDEGEFAYMRQLILQGIPPYLTAYNMKLPGIYAAYALMMSVLGQSVEGIHLGFLLINASTIIMVFLLVKYLYDSYTGIVASASFAILSVSPSVLGTSAHATHFVLLPALGGIFLMLKAIDSGKLKHIFWSGILLGLAFLMKQPGIFFIIFAFLYVLVSLFRRENASFYHLLEQVGVFLFGAVMPFGVACLVLYFAGVLEKFWFWTFSHPYDWGTRIPLSTGLEIFLNEIPHVIGKFYLLWGIAGLGVIGLFWEQTARRRVTFVLGFFVFSFLAVCPGLIFRNHYFVFLLPAIALLMGIAIRSLRRLLLKSQPRLQFIPTILFLLAFSVGVVGYRSFFFEVTPVQACRAMYGLNPFPESVKVAEYIRGHTKKEDKIAVLGSEAQIYFYSNRHSATGYIYTYQMMEDLKYALRMQKEMVEEIERAQPKYLVWVNVPTSWLVRPKSETYIFKWFEEYSKKNLDLVGVIDILSEIQTGYRWDSEATNYSPRSPYFLYVYKRKDT